MKRRTLLQRLGAAAASLPLLRVPLDAQELSADQVFVLRDVAATVLPSAIGRKGQDEAVDNFLRWIRDYKEGVPLSHRYGEPRLVKSGPSPAPGYAAHIAALQAAAKARQGACGVDTPPDAELRVDVAHAGSCRWQATRRPGAASLRTGSSRRQRSIA